MGYGRGVSRLLFFLAVFFAFSDRTVWAADLPLEQCLDFHEQGQVDHREGRLKDAREQFLRCSEESCPEAVKDDCAGWLLEVRSSIPSLVVAATRGDADLVQAELFVDGRLLSANLDGREWELDPGSHVVRISTPTGESLEQTVVLAPGERARLVRFVFDEQVLPTPPPMDPPEPASNDSTPLATVRPVPPSVWVFAGAAVVATGIGVGFGVAGLQENKTLSQDCAPYCDPRDKQRVDTKLMVADVSFGAAVVLGVTAGVLYLLRPERVVVSSVPTGASFTFLPGGGALPGGGVFGYARAF